MSIGALIGTVAGAVAGFFIGGPIGALYGGGLGFALGMAIDPLQPDINSVSPSQSELQITTNDVGSPIMDMLGTAKFTGNLLWYGLETSEEQTQETGGKGGSGETVVTGYKYYMSWQLGLCIGPVDAVLAIYKDDDDLLWEGEVTRPESGGEETIVIDGFGSIVFYFGTNDQVANTTLGAALEDSTLNPPLRGLCWAFFDHCYIGTYNRMPTIKFVLGKYPEISFDTENLYSVVQTYDYNPMHAIWYIMFQMTRLPETWLSAADFLSVAETLSAEQRGISVIFDRAQAALDYLTSINAHIDGILRYGIDGKFHPKLIRNDYVVGELPLIDPSVLLENPVFERPAWIDTINEVKVQYTELYLTDGTRLFCACDEVEIDKSGGDPLHMDIGDDVTLNALNYDADCVYEWRILAGGGRLSDQYGTSVSYRALTFEEVTIGLFSSGDLCDTLTIVVECNVTIDYTTLHMKVNEAQNLALTDALPLEDFPSDSIYKWTLSGNGSLSLSQGKINHYDAPSSNESCLDVPRITLSIQLNEEDEPTVCDYIDITINAYDVPVGAYRCITTCVVIRSAGMCSCYCSYDSYDCDDIYVDVSLVHCQEGYWGCEPEEAGLPCECDCPTVVDTRSEVLIEAGCCPTFTCP
jgi:hypothetical protein